MRLPNGYFFAVYFNGLSFFCPINTDFYIDYFSILNCLKKAVVSLFSFACKLQHACG